MTERVRKKGYQRVTRASVAACMATSTRPSNGTVILVTMDGMASDNISLCNGPYIITEGSTITRKLYTRHNNINHTSPLPTINGQGAVCITGG